MYQEDKPNPFPLNPIYNPNDWPGSRPTLIDVAFLDANYLKYPVAQGGTEILSGIIVNGSTDLNTLFVAGTSSFEDAINMTSTTANKRRIYSSYYNLKDVSGDVSRTSEISQSATTLTFNNQTTNGRTRFVNNDNTGSPLATFEIQTSGSTLNTPITVNGISNFNYNLNMSSGDPNESQITCGYLNFKDLNGNVARTAEIYQDGTILNITNEATSGITRFTNDDPSGLPTTIAEFGMNTNVNFYRNLTIRDNKNLVFVGGTGFINQSIVLGDISTKNFFKLSEFQIGSNNTNGTSTAFEFYDNVNGKGLFLLPNADNGSLGDTNRRNDCVLSSRSTQNDNAIVVSNWNTNMRNGLRVFTTDISNCGLTLQCGQNTSNDWTQFAMNYNRNTLTTTTSFNNVINFNPATGTGLPNAISSARRRLEGLGTLSFTDISGNNTTTGSTTSSIWTDSSLVNSLNGMYYDCGINGGFHQFSARDSGGNVSTPIYYGSNITSVSNTFIVRNATNTSNRLDFSVDNAQNTTIRTRTTTPNSSALIFWTCDTCAPSGTVTSNSIMVMTPFYTEIRRPFLLNYSTNGPSSASNLGFITGPTAMTTGSSIASSASERNFGSFTIANIGTYGIKVLISMAGSANHTLTECRWCLDGTSATFPSISTPTRYTPSITGIFGSSLSNTYTSYMNINLDITTTTANQIIYVNYVLNYSGGSTTTLNATFSYTRIG